ncbi:d-amino acid dehydrogenase [Diplodia corticola]|uniref:D-amino acid dehydrogenase n=1 Tax=Diplodia corticola TaxID=236234 RepID=A0A1J9R5I3_9PEZI|nr:d-amino acid dehydrogenase [Diplodia corticola]OJD35864.1 d-amino acid dehydrogenase [Diplodia corticola]
MGNITILGAGITGLATAWILRSKGHTVTIIARDLPPKDGQPIDLDTASKDWASPWAGAFYMPDINTTPQQRRMQALTLPHLLRLADADAASSSTNSINNSSSSSIRRIPIDDMRDDGARLADVWYAAHVPGFAAMPAAELPAGCTLGVRWQTVVLQPAVLLPWLRARLEEEGGELGGRPVRFVRREVRSLEEAVGAVGAAPCDVLVNAAGNGARDLLLPSSSTFPAGDGNGGEKAKMQPVRGQTHVVRTGWDRVFMRQGSQYTYCIPRLDGTAVVGGVKGAGADDVDPRVSEDQRTDIFGRVGDNLPHVFAAFPADFDVVRDNVGFRPGREGGPRVEREVVGDTGLKVVHAYGVSGSGYGYSFGLGEVVSEMVDEFLLDSPSKAKL